MDTTTFDSSEDYYNKEQIMDKQFSQKESLEMFDALAEIHSAFITCWNVYLSWLTIIYYRKHERPNGNTTFRSN